MIKRSALVLCALLLAVLLAVAGCQPSREALLQQGIISEDYDLQSLCQRVEAAILAGETQIAINYRGNWRNVESDVHKGLRQIQGSLSYLAARFLESYTVQCSKERGYVPTKIDLELRDAELLSRMPRQDEGGLKVDNYGADLLESLLMEMFQSKEPRAIRCYTGIDLDGLNQALNRDLNLIMKDNYAYSYMVESVEWTVSDYTRQDGSGLLEADLQITYEAESLPLSEIPVVEDKLALIQTLIQGWEAGQKKVTLIMDGIRPDENSLFAWINTAEVNSASLACEGDSIWYEIMENPSDKQIGRFWLEYTVTPQVIARAQAELDAAIQREAEALWPQIREANREEAYATIFQRVLDITEYSDEIREATEQEMLTQQMQILRSAYGALVEGSTVCTGYARAFQALCDEFRLPCWTVNGYQDGEGHAWNMVLLGDEIRYVDCTFADTGGRPARYFLFTQEELEARHYVLDAGFVTRW